MALKNEGSTIRFDDMKSTTTVSWRMRRDPGRLELTLDHGSRGLEESGWGSSAFS